MQGEELLDGINVLDLTQRLPGPLSTSILFDLGANVTKVEPPGKEDAFILFAKEDPLFKFWYDSLNSKKDIIKTNHSYSELSNILKKTDIVVISCGSNIKEEIIENESGSLAIIEVCGSSKNISMHDINVLAQSPSFELYTHNQTADIINPPHLTFQSLELALDSN